MKKNNGTIIFTLLLSIICLSGCSSKKEFGEEYNPDTDYQYTYVDTFDNHRQVQSGNGGKYIWYNNFIYFLNEETGSLSPLCAKANCMHDQETDTDKLKECNANAQESENSYSFISYYDGNVYFVQNDTLYRISQDGSKKDAIFLTEDGANIEAWLIHRGVLYYNTQEYYSINNEKIGTRVILKAIKLGSHMSEKNAEIVYQSDEGISVLTFAGLRAYKSNLYFKIIANDNNKKRDGTTEGWIKALSVPYFCYNIGTKEIYEVKCPEGYGEYANISDVFFMEDKVLIEIYDATKDGEYKLPVFSADYDMKNMKIWMDEIEQEKQIQTNGDKVIISDGSLLYEKGYDKDFNVEVYDSNANLIDTFIYPVNMMGNLGGSGLDGEILEFTNDKSSWYIKGFNINSIGNYNGSKVELEDKGTRAFGTLNNPEE